MPVQMDFGGPPNLSVQHPQFRLGPEFLLGQVLPKGIIAVFPSHQWDVGGWSDQSYSVTTVQVGGAYFLGGGTTLTTFPKIQYNWETDQWTVPLNLAISQTVVSGNMPIKYALIILNSLMLLALTSWSASP